MSFEEKQPTAEDRGRYNQWRRDTVDGKLARNAFVGVPTTVNFLPCGCINYRDGKQIVVERVRDVHAHRPPHIECRACGETLPPLWPV